MVSKLNPVQLQTCGRTKSLISTRFPGFFGQILRFPQISTVCNRKKERKIYFVSRQLYNWVIIISWS